MAETATIFKPLRDKFKPLGMSVRCFFSIAGVAVAGFLLALGLSNVHYTTNEMYTKAERQAVYEQLVGAQEGLERAEIAMANQGAESLDDTQISSDLRYDVEVCRQYGITSDTALEDIAQITPAYRQVEKQLLSLWTGVGVFVLLPVVAGFCLFVETGRRTLYGILTRWAAFRRSQKLYRNLPVTYAERECGMPYQAVVARAREQREGAAPEAARKRR